MEYIIDLRAQFKIPARENQTEYPTVPGWSPFQCVPSRDPNFEEFIFEIDDCRVDAKDRSEAVEKALVSHQPLRIDGMEVLDLEIWNDLIFKVDKEDNPKMNP